jgi:hypothetical protein
MIGADPVSIAFGLWMIALQGWSEAMSRPWRASASIFHAMTTE